MNDYDPQTRRWIGRVSLWLGSLIVLLLIGFVALIAWHFVGLLMGWGSCH